MTLKAKLFSDIHLELLPPFTGPNCFSKFGKKGDADVLILAGDICSVKHFGSPEGDRAKLYNRFFSYCSETYPKVFYVPGNLESYGFNLSGTTKKLKEALSPWPNISVLENSSEWWEGWHFVGATLWTNFFNDPSLRLDADCWMNDYKSIRYTEKFRRLNASDTVKINSETLYWMERALATLRGPVFVITHHAPTTASRDPKYTDMVGAYCNTLGEFILSRPSIKYWVHGHIHQPCSYDVGECNVVANPVGYHFDPPSPTSYDLVLDLPTYPL